MKKTVSAFEAYCYGSKSCMLEPRRAIRATAARLSGEAVPRVGSSPVRRPARPRTIPTGPGAERMGWPAAALVILGSSVLLWLGVGASVAWVMGWR